MNSRTQSRAYLLTAAIYAVAGILICACLIVFPSRVYPSSWVPISAIASAAVLPLSLAIIPFKPRLGHAGALAAAAVALLGFAWTEISLPERVNTWNALNLAGRMLDAAGGPWFPILRLASIACLVCTALCSILRLLPDWVLFRGRPLRLATWPALAGTGLVFAAWFVRAATPYHLPVIVDGLRVDLTIVHIEKDGLRYRETTFGLRSGRITVSRTDRLLFRCSFDARFATLPLDERIQDRMRAIMDAADQPPSAGRLPDLLYSWSGERWYVAKWPARSPARIVEYSEDVPREVVDLYNAIERIPAASGEQTSAIHDICLGFCYEPAVALAAHARQRESP